MKLKSKNMDAQTILILVFTGILSGTLGGLVGIGGGIIIVPALIYFLGFSQWDAQGTSLALLMFPVGILGVMQYYKHGHVHFGYVAFIAVGFLLGGYLGSKISLSIPQEQVKRFFAIFMILIAVKMLFFDSKPLPTRATAEQKENLP